jgi:hypothetical protein
MAAPISATSSSTEAASNGSRYSRRNSRPIAPWWRRHPRQARPLGLERDGVSTTNSPAATISPGAELRRLGAQIEVVDAVGEHHAEQQQHEDAPT